MTDIFMTEDFEGIGYKWHESDEISCLRGAGEGSFWLLDGK